MAPYPVESLSRIFDYLSQGTPVLIFHKTEFLSKAYWHYSVITGFNQQKETFSVHIGPYPHHEMEISDVVGSWKEGGSWAYVFFPPAQLPKSARFVDAIENSLAFLRIDSEDSALVLSTEILKRWPERYEADVISAEALMKKNESGPALVALKQAFRKRPDNEKLKQKIAEFSKVKISKSN